MSEELTKSIQGLIDSGKGDTKRLHEILHTLKQGSPLYLSDFRYLESLKSNQTQEPKDKTDLMTSSTPPSLDDVELFSMNKNYFKELKEDGDAMIILRTRLANSEISIEEFRAIKKALKDA